MAKIAPPNVVLHYNRPMLDPWDAFNIGPLVGPPDPYVTVDDVVIAEHLTLEQMRAVETWMRNPTFGPGGRTADVLGVISDSRDA